MWRILLVHTVHFFATAIFCMRFYEIVHTVRWVWMRFAMYTIGIAHRNCTEWIWNPFTCDIAHRKASHAETTTLCEHFHKPTYNPITFHKLHVNKSQSQTKKTVPCERALEENCLQYARSWRNHKLELHRHQCKW